MPFEDIWLRDGKPSPLDFERRMYEQTKNPIHVWRAVEMCSELMRGGVYGCDSLPRWILDYLDTPVVAIRELLNEAGAVDGKEIGERVLGAFDVRTPGQGVRSNAFIDAALQSRDMSLASMVRRKKQEHPTRSIEAIVADVAEDLERESRRFDSHKANGEIIAWARRDVSQTIVSESTIRKAWLQWKDFLETNFPAKSTTSV